MRRTLLVSLALILSGSPCLAANSDNQLWTSIYTTTALNSRFDLVANGQLRFGDNMSDLSQESFQGGFNYKVFEYLTLSPSCG